MNVSLFAGGCLAELLCSMAVLAQPAAPLAPLAYYELVPSAERPIGWLRQQLEVMLNHSTSHPDEGSYFTLAPQNSWNYNPPRAVVEDPARATTVAVKTMAATASGLHWNAAHAPVEIAVSGWRLPDRQLSEGLYKGPVDPTPETLTFIPYGCTKLRVVALPVVS